MKTISFKLPAIVAEQLAETARARRKAKSSLIREFIEQGLMAQSPPGEPSFHALAADKAGSFRGPSDLATNSKHLEGFGL